MSMSTEGELRCGHCEDFLNNSGTTAFCLTCASQVCNRCIDDSTYLESSTDDSRDVTKNIQRQNSSKCRVGDNSDPKRILDAQVNSQTHASPSLDSSTGEIIAGEVGDILNVYTDRVSETVCQIRDTITISEKERKERTFKEGENKTQEEILSAECFNSSEAEKKDDLQYSERNNSIILEIKSKENMPDKLQVGDLLGPSAKITGDGFISVTVPLQVVSETWPLSVDEKSDTNRNVKTDFYKQQGDELEQCNEQESGYGSQNLLQSSNEMLTKALKDSNQNLYLIKTAGKNVFSISDLEQVHVSNKERDDNGNMLTKGKPSIADCRGKSASFDEATNTDTVVTRRNKNSSSDKRYVRGHSRSSSLPDLLKPTIERNSAVLGSSEQLSKSTDDILENETKTRVSFQMCDKDHKDTPTYICLKDNEIYCKVCVQIHNLHCKEKVKFIPEIPPETRTKVCEDSMRELLSAKERFNHVKEELCEDLQLLKNSRKVYVRSVMRFKQNLINIIDQIEKDALADMDLIYTIECDKIQKSLAKLEANIAALDRLLQEVKNQECDEDNSVFYKIQSASNSVVDSELALHDIHKSCFKTDFSFQPLEAVKSMCTNSEKLWTIKLTKDVKCHAPYPCTCDRSFKYRKAELHKQFLAKLSRWSFDRDKCYISGCEFLENGNLLLADNHNKKIKMFDKKYKCISALHLSSLPWDLAVLDKQMAVVSIPDKKQLQFFETNTKLVLRHSVNLEKNCWGVAKSNDLLVVSCWSRDKSEILLLDTDGVLKRTITAVDRTPFNIPWYLSVFGDVIRVSDWGSNDVTFMTLTGKMLNQYSDNALKGAMGVCSDPEGNVYVCGRDTNTIHQVSSDGRKVQAILSERDGIDKPLCVCHCPLDNRFVVTSWMSDTVQVFKLQ